MVKVMTQLGEESNLTRDIYPLVESMANKGDLGEKWKARVRATLEENSSDCDAYTGRYDLFENKSVIFIIHPFVVEFFFNLTSYDSYDRRAFIFLQGEMADFRGVSDL